MKKTKENGRDRLIVSALSLFCERGYHGVSVREICDHANANPSLISFHFGGKEALLETIFEGMLSEKFETTGNILSNVENEVDFKFRLTLFFKSYVEFYLENSEVVSLYFDQFEREHPYAIQIFPQTFGKLWNGLLNFIQQAQEKGIVDQSLDSKVLAFSLWTPVNASMRSKRSTHRACQFSLKDQHFIDLLIKQIIDSIKLAA
ncbi:TetR family transcriptional regulator [Bacteriovorax sp. PP10]|uniref:TetR family transcriptional regulator n=1 Tax=Bacteriovorax antarcticus TaxID=3088717 RepID=A0ABU5VSS9_9BACT|nr:TetR family transcriptional regulator [Bacteriovorax sp. PP10]MEA9356109.1 TetR family transcriptional regulator [Bacteriovorax sp. PP10]